MEKLLFKRSTILLLTTVLANAVPFLAVLLLIRSYSADDFGYLSWLLSSYAVFSIIFDLGFSNSILPKIIGFTSKNRYVREFIYNSFIMKIVLGLLLSIVCGSYDVNLVFIILSSFLYSIFPAFIFVGLNKYITMFFLVVVPKLVFLLMVVLFDKSDVIIVVYSLLFSSLLSMILGFLLVEYIGIEILRVKFSKRRFFYFVRRNKGFFLSRISLSIYQQGGGFILGFLTTTTIVGHYYIAEQIYKIALTVLYPISQALYATVVQDKNLNVYFRFVFLLLSLSLAGAIFAVSFMSSFGGDIYGELWGSSKEIFVILMCVFVVHSMTLFVGYPLYNILGSSDLKYVNLSSFYALLMFLIYLFVCEYSKGIEAIDIAVAILVSEIFSLIIRVYGVLRAKS